MTAELFLRLPPPEQFVNLSALLEDALSSGLIAWVLADAAYAAHREMLESDAGTICRQKDVSLLIADHPEFVSELAIDGVQLSDPACYPEVRRSLGDDAAIGVYCGDSRHLAMTVAENGADYVAFPTLSMTEGGEPLIGWWSEMFEVPCVAADPVSVGDLPEVLTLNPDFICPDDLIWESGAKMRETLEAFKDAMVSDQP